MTLKELDAIHHYQTDKLGGCSINRHDYSAAYEFHFAKYRDQPITFWEIGVDRGGSLKMWCDYFSKGTVVGIDIKSKPADYICPANGFWEVGDATNEEVIKRLLVKYGPPDIVLDDGSHMAKDIGDTFLHLFAEFKSIYAVEDLGTQYKDKHGGMFVNDEPYTDTMIDFCNQLARNEEHPAIKRVCWESGIVFLYKE
jgi:hypothetical protein